MPDSVVKLAQRRLARTHVMDYAQMVVPGFKAANHTKYLCETLEAVERGDIRRLIINAPPGHGKPVSVDALILMGDGSYKRLGDVVVGDKVISGEGVPQEVEAVYEQPSQEGVYIATLSGRTVQAALDHPFLTPDGWVKAGDLRVDMSLGNVAAPKTNPSIIGYSDEHYRLVGYFIGDGCCVHGNANVTNIDPGIIADLDHCASVLGFRTTRLASHNRTSFSGGVRKWLADTGLIGNGSYEKRVPDWVFKSSPEQIAHFLGAYFDCDGYVHLRSGFSNRGRRQDVAVELYSVSRELLADCQKLFLRLGIQTRLRPKLGKYKGLDHQSFRLSITDMDGVARFRELVPLKSAKAERTKRFIRTKFQQSILTDPIIGITEIGQLDCRCLTVAVDHTFTAEDFIVHNSTTVQAWTSWFLGRNPQRRVIMLSANEQLALRNSRAVRSHIMDPDFPFDTQLSTDTTSVQEWRLNNGKGGLKAVGQGGIITGFRCDAVVSDDIQPDAGTPETMRSLDEWWREILTTRLDPGGVVVMIATRWSTADLVARLLEGKSGNLWTVINLPAIAYGGKDLLGRADGEALWPEVWPISELERLREECTEYAWESQYQGKPMPAGGTIFHEKWVTPNTYTELPVAAQPEDLGTVLMKRNGYEDPFAAARARQARPYKILSIDCAASSNVASDFSVITTLCYCGGYIYVVDVDRDRSEWNDLMNRVLKAAKKHNPVRRVLIENASAGISLVQELIRTTKLPVVRTTPKDSKLERAMAVTGYFEGNRVKWPVHAPWKPECVAELLNFPGGRHDDFVDSLVQGVGYLMNNSMFSREKQSMLDSSNNRMVR